MRSKQENFNRKKKPKKFKHEREQRRRTKSICTETGELESPESESEIEREKFRERERGERDFRERKNGGVGWLVESREKSTRRNELGLVGSSASMTIIFPFFRCFF